MTSGKPADKDRKPSATSMISQLTNLKENVSKNLKEGGEILHLDDLGGLLNDLSGIVGKDKTTEGENIAMIDHSNQAEVHRALREIVIYCCFMVIYTISTIRGLNDADVYKFGANIEGQLAGVEMLPEHSPSWGKNYYDIATVEEFYHWLQGPFVHTIFSPSTFDGDAQWRFQGGSPKGYLLGYGKFMGAVRISQLRVESSDCTNRVPDQVAHYYNFTCYGDREGRYSASSELDNDYGTFASNEFDKIHGSWRFDGYKAHGGESNQTLIIDPLPEGTVKRLRSKWYSQWTSTSRITYPVGAYAIHIDPAMGPEAGRELVKDLVKSQYIDLHTRVVVVEFTVYNAMLDRVCHVRAAAELTKAGGVVPQFSFQTVRLWDDFTATDSQYTAFQVAVGLFYTYFALQEIREFYEMGWAYWKEYLNIAQTTNIILYIYATAASALAPSLFPSNEDIGLKAGDSLMGHMFVDFGPAVYLKRSGIAVQAMNALLNWIKMIAYLSYAPTFAVMNETLAKSAADVSGFLAVFVIVSFGFTQSHAMVFGGRLHDFRTLGQTAYTLLRSLLGDFNFEQLQRGHSYMGPFLFIVFVALAVFVVLNMLIAIISDAYAECRDKYRDVPPVHLRKELQGYVYASLLSVPLLGQVVRRVEKTAQHAVLKSTQSVRRLRSFRSVKVDGNMSSASIQGPSSRFRTSAMRPTQKKEKLDAKGVGDGSAKVVPDGNADSSGEGDNKKAINNEASGLSKVAGMMQVTNRKGSLLAVAAAERRRRNSITAGVVTDGKRGSWFSVGSQSSRQNSVTDQEGRSGSPSGRRGSTTHSPAESDTLGIISQELLGMRRELRTTMDSIAGNFKRQSAEKGTETRQERIYQQDTSDRVQNNPRDSRQRVHAGGVREAVGGWAAGFGVAASSTAPVGANSECAKSPANTDSEQKTVLARSPHTHQAPQLEANMDARIDSHLRRMSVNLS